MPRTRRLRAERTSVKALIGSTKQQWKTVAGQIKEVRAAFGPKTALGKRRTAFGEAPEHDEAAIEEAMVVREPITVVVSEKGWIRALRGHVSDLSGVAFKTDDSLKFAFPTESDGQGSAVRRQRQILHARRFASCRAAAGTASRSASLSISSRTPKWWLRWRIKAAANSWSRAGAATVSSCRKTKCLANTRKGKQVLNLKDDAGLRVDRGRPANWSRRSARTARW